jgi:hypothetical protein
MRAAAGGGAQTKVPDLMVGIQNPWASFLPPSWIVTSFEPTFWSEELDAGGGP